MLQYLNPDFWLKLCNEVVVIVGVSFLLVILWWKRDRVMLFLTGDTVLHITFLDCVWWTFFRCCGLCHGGWTRVFTCCQCCGQYRNSNLVKALGRFLGVASRQIEIRNIVVGDLPCGRGDFYVTVRCQHNPDMVTSLVEDSNPKVVHFPEVLTLKMRDSWLEARVVIKVMALQVVGHTELCSVHISAMRIMEWAKAAAESNSNTEKVKRFEMKPTNANVESVSPAWILMEFDLSSDVRDLDQLEGNRNTILLSSTTTQGHQTRLTQVSEPLTMIEMKENHPLLDNTGSLVQEPFEADLQFIERLRRLVLNIFTCCNGLVVLVCVSYCIFRYYVYSCYRQFRWLEIAYEKNETFPIPTKELMSVVRDCQDEVRGTGVKDGSTPCRPLDENIEALCPDLPNGQPRPTAFTGLFVEYFEMDVQGVKCFDGICQFRNQLTQWDKELIVAGMLLVLGAVIVRQCGNWAIRLRKDRLYRQRAEQIKGKPGSRAAHG